MRTKGAHASFAAWGACLGTSDSLSFSSDHRGAGAGGLRPMRRFRKNCLAKRAEDLSGRYGGAKIADWKDRRAYVGMPLLLDFPFVRSFFRGPWHRLHAAASPHALESPRMQRVREVKHRSNLPVCESRCLQKYASRHVGSDFLCESEQLGVHAGHAVWRKYQLDRHAIGVFSDVHPSGRP